MICPCNLCIRLATCYDTCVDDLKKFARYFRNYKVQLTLGIACIFASVIAGLFIPLIVGQAIDANWTEVSWSKLTISAAKVLGRKYRQRSLSLSATPHSDRHVAQHRIRHAAGFLRAPRRSTAVVLSRTSHRRFDGARHKRSVRSPATRRTDDHVHAADGVCRDPRVAADVHAQLVADAVVVCHDAAGFVDG